MEVARTLGCEHAESRSGAERTGHLEENAWSGAGHRRLRTPQLRCLSWSWRCLNGREPMEREASRAAQSWRRNFRRPKRGPAQIGLQVVHWLRLLSFRVIQMYPTRAATAAHQACPLLKVTRPSLLRMSRRPAWGSANATSGVRTPAGMRPCGRPLIRAKRQATKRTGVAACSSDHESLS